MSIFYTNKTITMNRGDSGVVLLSILNRDDTPFALPIGMKNPTIVFSVKAETDLNDLNSNMLIEEYMPIEDYTYYGYGTQNAEGQMRIHGGFYPKSKTVNTEESVLDTGIIYKVLANKKYMFVVPTTTPPEYPIGLTKREYAFAVPLVFEPAFTDRLSPGAYTYSIILLDSTSPIRRTEGGGTDATTVTDFDGFLKNVTLKQDLFGPQKLVLSDSPIARVHGEPIRRIYYIKPCSEESVANATASEITTGNVTSIALPPVYIATKEQLGGIIVGDTLQVDFRGVLNVSKEITDKIADLYAKIGDMTTLTTDEKTTLVGAINEVDAYADTAQQTADHAQQTADNAQQTADNATELANTGIRDAERAQETADNATTLANNGISKAEQAQQTADTATELANTGILTAEQAQTTANGAVDEAASALDRANQAYEKASDNVYAVGFMTLEEAITALNGYDNTVLKTNDNIIIVAQGSPDLYVTGVDATSVPYHFTTVDKFNDDLVKNTVLQIGYYKVAFYETNGQPVTVAYQNIAVKSIDWVASTEFADFPYEAKIELTDFVDYTTVPQVVFDIADTMSGNYAPICKSGDKCVYIYSKVQNEITLKTVITFAPNVNGASIVGSGYNNRGKWVASTTYAIDDLVYTDNGQYVCIEGITSTTSPEQDTTHWQATFVATGKTKSGLRFSGQNGNGTEVQKTFDGSTAVEVAFDENTMTAKEVNGVLEIGAKGTVPEALPQEASALKSGNLPTTGWTNVTAPLWQGVATFDKNGHNKTLLCNIEQQSLSKQGYTITDTSITANSDILMELTDDGGVKAYSMEAGKITVIRDTVPTQPIPYTYKVRQTDASGQFTLVNHFVPNVPVTSVNGQTGAVTIAVPTKTSQLENDSNFATKTDIPTKVSQLANDSNFATVSQVNAKYTKPSDGIPKADLAGAVQTSLGKADTALQSHQKVALASGANDGTLKLIVNGIVTDNIAVKGLKSAAYTESSAYATAAQGMKADDAMPKTGGAFTGAVTVQAPTAEMSPATKQYVDTVISTVKQFEYQVVTELPTAAKATMGKIYLKAHSHNPSDGQPDSYDEFITVESGSTYNWERIGNTDIDLSGYVPATRKINSKALSSDFNLSAADVGVTEAAFPGLNKTGTVTAVKMNGTTKNPASGVVDLGTIITSHQSLDGKQDRLSDVQLNAVNSGITEDRVGTYDGYATTIAGKQDKLSTAQLDAVNSGITETKRTRYDGYEATINQKANNADLAQVATSGSYNDLTDKPTILSEADVKGIKVNNAANADSARYVKNSIVYQGVGMNADANYSNFVTYDGSAARSIKFYKYDFEMQDALGSGDAELTLRNTGVTAGTYNSVTVDTKGRVTAGTNTPAVDTSGLVPKSAFSLSGTTLTITM